MIYVIITKQAVFSQDKMFIVSRAQEHALCYSDITKQRTRKLKNVPSYSFNQTSSAYCAWHLNTCSNWYKQKMSDRGVHFINKLIKLMWFALKRPTPFPKQCVCVTIHSFEFLQIIFSLLIILLSLDNNICHSVTLTEIPCDLEKDK